MSVSVSPEVIVCFTKAVDLLHSSLPHSSVQAASHDTTAATPIPPAQMHQLLELCADLLLVTPAGEPLEQLQQSGGPHPRTELRFATLLENYRFISLMHRILITNPATFADSTRNVDESSFTPVTFTALQCRVLRLFLDIIHVIAVFPYLVALLRQKLLDDHWLELLLRYAALYRHHHEMEAIVLEAVLLVTKMVDQALGDLPLLASSQSVVRPPPDFFVTQSEFIFLLTRVKDPLADDIVRNLALGIVKTWLCRRIATGETVPASVLLASPFRGPGKTLEALQRSQHNNKFVQFDDMFLAREAIGSAVVWLFSSYLTDENAKGVVAHVGRRDPSSQFAVRGEEKSAVVRPSFSQSLFAMCTASDILLDFLLSDGLDPLPPSVLHGGDVLYRGLNKFIAENLASKAIGGGSMEASEAALDILVQDSDVMKSVKDVHACVVALFTAVRDSAAHREAARFRLAIQTLVSLGRLDDVMNVMASRSYLLPRPVSDKSMVECIVDFISASATATRNKESNNENDRLVSPAAQLAIAVAIVCVAAAKAATRIPQLRDMCQLSAAVVLPILYNTLLVDGYKGEVHVVLSGPSGEHLNRVEYLDNSPEWRDGFASVHIMARAAAYILNPYRTEALKFPKSWETASNDDDDNGGQGTLRAAGIDTDDVRVSLIEKQHKLAFALISCAILGAL